MNKKVQIKSFSEAERLINEKYHADGPDHVNTYLRLNFRKHIKIIERTLKLPKGSNVLDVACGTGQFLVELAKAGFTSVGVDTFEEMDRIDAKIAIAKFNESGFDPMIIHGNATDLPFHHASFDLVTNFGMLEHIPPKVRPHVIREMFRMVRTGGYLFIIAGPNRNCPYDQHIPKIPFANWLPRRLKIVLAERIDNRLLLNAPWSLSRKEFTQAIPSSQADMTNLYSVFLGLDEGQSLGSFRLNPIWLVAYIKRRCKLHKFFGFLGRILSIINLEHCHILLFRKNHIKVAPINDTQRPR